MDRSIGFARLRQGEFGLSQRSTVVGTSRCGRRGDTSQRDVPTLQLNYLRGVDVFARANFG